MVKYISKRQVRNINLIENKSWWNDRERESLIKNLKDAIIDKFIVNCQQLPPFGLMIFELKVVNGVQMIALYR